VIEHEDLITEDREAIQIVGTLVMLERRDRRLQPCDMRLERHRHAIAKAPLRAIADDAEDPRAGRRRTEPERGGVDEQAVAAERAVCEQLEPHREQRVGERCQQRQPERDDEQQRLRIVAAPERAPHRRERRRQIVSSGACQLKSSWSQQALGPDVWAATTERPSG
jgi:hypothetical protein